MFNIIILYHYVMAFLVGIIVFTFIFIFLSFFRTYFFFNYKTFYEPQDFCSFSEFLAYFRSNLWNFRFSQAYENFISYIRVSIIRQKNKHLAFYKKDIKASLSDQIVHAPLLEFLWVVFPALILVLIAYPSIILLYYNEAYVEPIFNITVIGNQWFWTYEYNDFNLLKLFKRHIFSEKTSFHKYEGLHTNLLYLSSFFTEKYVQANKNIMINIMASIPRRLTVDCNMIIAKDPKFLRLLTTDQCLVIPAKTPIRFLITSTDVIHSWAVPSYGIKLDAVPGRINQQILTVPLMGTSWGQCSELCGVNHAFMPIEIKVLAFSDFLYFIQLKIKEILFPFLEIYYKERVSFVKKYVNKTLEFVKVVQHNQIFKSPFKPWLMFTKMAWDKKNHFFTNYTMEQLFYFIFQFENKEYREARVVDFKATKLMRNIFHTRAALADSRFKQPISYWDFSIFLKKEDIVAPEIHNKILTFLHSKYPWERKWVELKTTEARRAHFMNLYQTGNRQIVPFDELFYGKDYSQTDYAKARAKKEIDNYKISKKAFFEWRRKRSKS